MGKSAHNFKWTPEAKERLRQLAGTIPNREIAERMGCTQSAVDSEITELGISQRKRGSQAKAYMLRYQVSAARVRSIGVERLGLMSEEARALMLHMHSKQGPPQQRKHAPTLHPKSLRISQVQRINRMMYLARKVS